MSETYEDEHGLWEIRQMGGRTVTVLIEAKEKPVPQKKRAKKGAKKSAGKKSRD